MISRQCYEGKRMHVELHYKDLLTKILVFDKKMNRIKYNEILYPINQNNYVHSYDRKEVLMIPRLLSYLVDLSTWVQIVNKAVLFSNSSFGSCGGGCWGMFTDFVLKSSEKKFK